MKFTDDILPVTDFRNHAADVLAQLGKTGRPIVLTQRGRASAVLMEVHAYQSLRDRLEELDGRLSELEARDAPSPTEVSPPLEDPNKLTSALFAELEEWIRE